jgi:CheY-like chemotaxis protein
MLYALTAHTLPQDRKRALQAGCDGYVSKPIHVQSFLGVIKEAFEKIDKS